MPRPPRPPCSGSVVSGATPLAVPKTSAPTILSSCPALLSLRAASRALAASSVRGTLDPAGQVRFPAVPGQMTHAERAVAPRLSLAVPLGQTWQYADIAGAQVPTGQTSQLKDPARVPAGHGLQTAPASPPSFDDLVVPGEQTQVCVAGSHCSLVLGHDAPSDCCLTQSCGL